MTLIGKFIQKEGARKDTRDIIVFLMKFSWQMTLIPFQYQNDGFSQENFNVENELSFLVDDQ